MKRFGLLSSTGLGSAALLGLSVAFVTPAFAQDESECTEEQVAAGTCDTEQELESGEPATNEQNLVVTGTRIRRPNLESNLPVTSIGGEEFFQQGQNNIGDTLNDLPQLATTFGQQNAGRFLGTTGLNLLDLRGLGTQRTLVLINGRRHVPADILNNGVSPDVNTIPNDLIERVDIVTGGNSAVYGSDAIAGVVNFILRRDFEGFQFRGHAGISEYGAAGNQYVSGMYGMNFADGRGNVTIHGEFARQDRTYASDVPFLRQVDNFVLVDQDPGGTPNGSDGIPDRVFMRDIRQANINIFTQIAFTQRTGQPGGPQCGTGFNNTPFNCVFFFDPTGTQLIPLTGTRVSTGPIGASLGGNGLTGRELNALTVFPFQERYNANLLARYTISDALEPFVEAKFVRVNTQGQQSSPAFTQGSSIDLNRERVRLDNPFLSPELRTQITNLLLQYNTNPGLSISSGSALTATQIAAINAGTFRLPIQRFLLDLGIRDERSQRDTFRVVGGLRGTFLDDWSYEVSANYGRVEEDTTVLGNIDIQRFLLAMDAGRNPVTGEIQCRAQFDPAARIDPFGFGPERLAEDVAACVPYNPFGFTDNSAARAYIVRDTVSRSTLDQLVLSAFATGDTSQWFELPGGPVAFAVGAEYRRETLFYQADPLVEGGFTFYNALPTFEPDPFDVKEAFAEIRIPLLRDMSFFEDLSLSAAARVAHYGGSTGTVFAYNAGAEWSPVRDIRFRGNYARAVRAPNLTETSFPLTQNFAPGFQDPCRPTNIGSGSQFRAPNCQADLGSLLTGFDLPNYSLQIRSGSNPDLNEESSDSWTVGAVIQPRWIPGLSVTVDYYNITVSDVISSPSAQAIVNTCYDLPSLDNQFCRLFQRFRGPGLGPLGEIPGQIRDADMEVIPLNFAALEREGIDFEVAYRQTLDENTRLNTRLIYTHNLKISNFTNPSLPDFENRVMGELGTPQDEFHLNVDLTHREVTFGYQMRYIGKQVVNLWEDFHSVQGRPPQDADWADIRFYPSVLYHDARVSIEAGEGMNFYFGVDNFTDRAPPLGLTGVGGGSGIYNVRGRNFYAGARFRF